MQVIAVIVTLKFHKNKKEPTKVKTCTHDVTLKAHISPLCTNSKKSQNNHFSANYFVHRSQNKLLSVSQNNSNLFSFCNRPWAILRFPKPPRR